MGHCRLVSEGSPPNAASELRPALPQGEQSGREEVPDRRNVLRWEKLVPLKVSREVRSR